MKTMKRAKSDPEPSAVAVDWIPELLEDRPQTYAPRLLSNPLYAVQRRYPGYRMCVGMVGASDFARRVFALDASGKMTKVPPCVESALRRHGKEMLVDGTFDTDRFIAFDLMFYAGVDTSGLNFEDRFGILRDRLGDTVLVARTEFTEPGKRELFTAAVDRGDEGICFRQKRCPYMPGRQGRNLKVKFAA